MRAEVEMVSPAMAKEYLERAVPNRPIQDSTVPRYVRDMKEGKWQANGQGIVFNASGELLDGRHRCTAVLRAGVTLAMLVIRGVDSKAFVTMDSGRGRTINDVLAIEGVKNTAVVASGIRIAMNYIAGIRYNYGIFTRSDYEEFVRKHPYIQLAAEAAVNYSAKGIGLSRGSLAGVFFLANESSQYSSEVISFMEGLSSGIGLWKGDPRLTLRNWLLTRKTSIGAITTEEHFCAAVKVWNAFAQGKKLHNIRLLDKPTRETLPIVGFEPANYPEIPDLSGLAREEAELRTNLPKALATPPLVLP